MSDVLAWECDTGSFLHGRWRARLNRDRWNAWIELPDEVGDYRWSIEDNTCGRVLAYGYTETFELAKQAAEYAAMNELLKPGVSDA